MNTTGVVSEASSTGGGLELPTALNFEETTEEAVPLALPSMSEITSPTIADESCGGDGSDSLSDWMASEPEAAARLTPFQFCFPASHNSAACDVPTSEWICGQRDVVNRSAQFSLARRVRSDYVFVLCF